MIRCRFQEYFRIKRAGRPPERKGKLPKGWIPARVSVSGTPHKMRRTVTGSGALSSWTGKNFAMNVPIKDCRSWLCCLRAKKALQYKTETGKRKRGSFLCEAGKKMGHVSRGTMVLLCAVTVFAGR